MYPKFATPLLGQNDRIVGAVLVLRDATETYERDRRLSHLATHDVLTGACNRFEFERRLQVLFDRARLLILPATLLAVDLDCFKAVKRRRRACRRRCSVASRCGGSAVRRTQQGHRRARRRR